MSFMTTNMSAQPIWGFNRNDAEWRIAKQAGWARTDLMWERMMEAANRAWAAGEPAARRKFVVADLLARSCFAKNDPRRATTAAALAVIAASRGKKRAAGAAQKRALSQWQNAQAFIDGMEIRPRSRSSLFHLRMETRHRDTFHSNLRLRFSRIAQETQESLEALGTDQPLPHRHFARWKGEKPTVYDDTRKMLGSCLLFPEA